MSVLGSDSFLAIGFAGSFFRFSSGSAGSACTWLLECISGNKIASGEIQEKWKIDPTKQGDVILLSYNIAAGSLTILSPE